MNKKVYIKTFGCQMNEYDSNRIFDMVKKIGFEKTFEQGNADCYILNTCHIRDKSKEKDCGSDRNKGMEKMKPDSIVADASAEDFI